LGAGGARPNAILAAVIPVHQFMPKVLAEVLRKAPLSPEKVAFAWRAAVGPAVDNATTIDLREQVLVVRVTDVAWQREVERSAALIRARLDSLLGDGVVRRVEVIRD
jgi:hypothetical protein